MMNTVMLYHFSYDPIPEFILRVPKYRLQGEDNTIPRICVARSLEDCVNAKVCQALPMLLLSDHEIPIYGFLYRIEVQSQDVITPDALLYEYGVLDAELNQEHWIISNPVKVQESIIKIIDFRYSFDTAWTYPIADRISYQEVQSLPEKSFQGIIRDICNKTDVHKTSDIILVGMADTPGFFERVSDLLK